MDKSAAPIKQVRYGIAALTFVALTGIGGYVFLCGLDPFDALYLLVITISTVGYTEVGTASPMMRVVNIYVILLGITAGVYAFGGLVQMIAEGQVRRVVTRQLQMRKIDSLSKHHIVCGYGRMGRMICEMLHDHNEPVVLVERERERVENADRAGLLTVQGDAAEEETLTSAGIERAQSLTCVLPSDADNMFVTLTGRDMNADLFILARAEQLSTEKKLVQAGADRVVSPQAIGAQRFSNLLLRPTTVEILELVTGRKSVDLEMNEVTIPDGGPIHGQTLADADIRSKTGVIVVAIKRSDGNLIVNPDSDVTLCEKDTVVILGRRENIDSFTRQFAS